MKKYLIILFIALTQLLFASVCENEKMKAIFLYNFTKYINWPEENTNGEFIIGVVNNDNLVKEMETIAKLKKSQNNQKLVIKKLTDPDMNVNILYVDNSWKGSLSSLINEAKTKHVLLISDSKDCLKKGFAIELIINQGQAEFDINKKNLKSCKLSVSQELLDMARNIE